MEKKIIAVIGATGTQGGGLVRAILNDPSSEFSVRAITRNADSDKARALAALGAEVVEADIDDEKTLGKAFEGAYGAYLVTFFWHHMNTERETKNAKNMAKAAKNAGLQHVIYSTLEDTRNFSPLADDRMPVVEGKFKVPHMDSKAEAESYFTLLGIPVTFMLTTVYWENFCNLGMGPKRHDGMLLWNFNLANAIIPGLATEDIGKCAYGIFKKKGEYIRKKVGIAGDHLTFNQYAEALSEALGEKVYYEPLGNDDYRALYGDDVGNSFQFMTDFNKEFVAARSLEFSRSVNPEMQTFKQWLANNKHLIPID